MDISVKALSGPPTGLDGLPSYREDGDGPTIRVTVATPKGSTGLPFEFAKLRLQGAVKSQVGSQVAVQKILNLVEECSWSQFTPLYTTDGSGHRYSATITFSSSEKGAASIASTRRMLPTTSMTGSTYVTKHTALSDQSLVEGRCETCFWVSADFLRDGASVHSSRSPVSFDCTPSLLSFQPSLKTQSSGLSVACRPRKAGMLANLTGRRRSPSAQSSARVQLPDDSLIIGPGRMRDGQQCHTVSIPLQASLAPASAQDGAAMYRDGLCCDVETKWVSRRTFTTGSSAHEEVAAAVTKRTVSTQQSDIVFPPVYGAGARAGGGDVSTTGILQVILPESAAFPTHHSDLLQVSYELEMRFLFRLGSGPALEGRAKISCILGN